MPGRGRPVRRRPDRAGQRSRSSATATRSTGSRPPAALVPLVRRRRRAGPWRPRRPGVRRRRRPARSPTLVDLARRVHAGDLDPRRGDRRAPVPGPAARGRQERLQAGAGAAPARARRGLAADPDDPAPARLAGDDRVEGGVERVERDLLAVHARDRAAGGPSRGGPRSTRRRSIGMLTESMPSSATPRRMNGKTVVASVGPPALPLGTPRPRRSGASAARTGASRRRPRRPPRPSVPTRAACPRRSTSSRVRIPAAPSARQPRRLLGLAGRGPDLVAAVGQDRDRRPADAARWRPSRAPGRRPGVRPRSSSATTDIAAVNPAVPMAIASRGVRPGASGTTQPAGTRWYCA